MSNGLKLKYSCAGTSTRLLLVILLFVLGACSSIRHQSAVDDWPVALPEKAHYIALYQLDAVNQQVQSQEEYLKWVKRFYHGWALSPYSWDWMTKNALDQTALASDRALVQELLASIGYRVSGEWAKDSNQRQINSVNLLTWGDALKMSVKRGQQVELARQISADVDRLLAHELEPDMIDFDRYFPDNSSVIAADDHEYDPFDV